MNKANILKVADAIEKGSLVKRGIGFNMRYLAGAAHVNAPDHIDSCGTVCCIAGHAFALKHPRMKPKAIAESDQDIDEEATAYLGLTGHQKAELFYQMELIASARGRLSMDAVRNSTTPAHAVAVLRHLAETGLVDWSIAPAPTKQEEDASRAP